MTLKITIDLDDLDEKCIRYFAADPQDWVNNFVRARIFAAKQEIYQSEVRRMTADPNVATMPADVNAVVLAADIRYANSQPEIPAMIPPV